MYKNIFYEKREKSQTVNVWIWDDQNEEPIVSEFPLYAYKKSPTGEYTSIYGDKLEKTYDYRYGEPGLFESDVPVETLILRDLYWESDDISTNHRVVYFDIETDSTDGYPNMETANKAITAICIYFDSKYTVFLLDVFNKIKNRSKDGIEVRSYSSEEDLLNSFILEWKKIKPTIISGWNIDRFDIPYVNRRINKIFGKDASNQLSEIGRIKYNKRQESNGSQGPIYQIAGISSLDYILLYKKYSGKMMPNYRLDTIGKKEVGMGKIEYEGSLQSLYENDIEKFVEYNINDVRIVVALEEKRKFIDLARSICHKGHVGYESHHISSRFIEGAMLTYMRRKELVASNKPKLDDDFDYENDDMKFEGAYVKEPIPGLYKWVYDSDLQSLYPSIMRSLNISPETKIGRVINWNVELYIKGQLNEVSIEGTDIKMNISDFKSFVEKNKYSIGSNGVLYSTEKQGIICEILDNWFVERVEFRKLEKKYGNEKNEEMYNFYNRRQIVQKVLLNSIYGCVGLPTWRWYDKDNAECVTITGQTIIKTTCKMINNYYKSKMGSKYKLTYIDGSIEYKYGKECVGQNTCESLFKDFERKNSKKLIE